MTDLKKGTKVRILLEGVLDKGVSAIDGEYDNLWLDNGTYLESVPYIAVEPLGIPLPTKYGAYIPANNVKNLEYTYVYFLRRGEWMQFTGEGVNRHAHEAAQDAHDRLGGLIPLVVAQ
jgi:hypothetical protein